MDALAIVLESPGQLALQRLPLADASDDHLAVDIEWTSISTGTERLLFEGRMPPFPGMGYPLVPGYEAVGRVRSSGAHSGFRTGERVFVPGARLFRRGPRPVRRGGVASRRAGAARRRLRRGFGRAGSSARAGRDRASRDCVCSATPSRICIVGHGVLGRLLARLDDRARRRAAGRLGTQLRARRAARSATTSSIPRPMRDATIASSATSAATRHCSTR